MRVSTITCVGYHPKGISLHLRNLHWAVDRDHDCHIVTKEGWGVRPVDCHLTTVPGSIQDWYPFWNLTVPGILERINADVVLFSEQDMIYTQKLGHLIDRVYKTDCIIQNSDPYGWDIHKKGEIVFPRIWEGGLIARKDRLLDYLATGKTFGGRIQSLTTIEMIKNHFDGEYVVLGKDCQKYSLNTLTLEGFPGWGSYTELMFELQLHCYYEKLAVERTKFLTHIPRPEFSHKDHPDCYKEVDEFTASRIAKDNSWTSTGTLFMYTLSGVTSLNQVVKQRINLDHVANWIDQLMPHAQEWLSSRELDVIRDFSRLIDRRLPII